MTTMIRTQRVWRAMGVGCVVGALVLAGLAPRTPAQSGAESNGDAGASPSRDAGRRSLVIKPPDAPGGQPVELYQASYALLIGVSDYEHLPVLPGVKEDIPAVRAQLEQAGFAVTEVMNPTGAALREAFESFIAGHGGQPKARLLFYFAGHGKTLKFADGREMGYIVPADAPHPDADPSGFKARALSMQHIESFAKNIESPHALFLFDSCFSGSLFELSRAIPEHITYKTTRPVRQFVTAGAADETVPDRSIFRRQFLEALQGEGDTDKDGFVTGTELGEFLQKTVIRYSNNCQHPQYGKIRDADLDKGDFVFEAIKAPFVVPPPTPKPPTPAPPITSTPSTGPRKSNLEARNALDELKAAFDKKKLSLKDKLAYLDDFTRDWPGTTAGDEAAAMIASIRRLEKLQAEAQKEFDRLMERDARPPLTQADAARRAADWAAYLQQYADADYRLSEARAQCQRYTDWKPAPQPGEDFTLDLGGGVQLELVWIPGGTFQMGSPSSEEDRDDDEGPVHTVTVDGFWMGKYEVTQEQYEAVMGTNPSYFKGARNPVEQVSWNDATEFCRKLSSQTSRTGPTGLTCRLPTEAEWEYACRAGTTTPFHFGNTISTSQANYNGNYVYGSGSKGEYRERTMPVGSFLPNAFGLYDMHGNVWEWCQDWHGNYSSSSQRNPTGPSSGKYRVLRGGSWLNNPGGCRSSDRSGLVPDVSGHVIGFRVVWVSAGLK